MSTSDGPALAAPAVAVAAARPVAIGEHCRNCGAALYGEYCYACGQPRVGWVRRVRELTADFIDVAFNLDARFFRTLLTLFFRPGRMTVEYLGGARARYATPFRLFLVLAATAFLLVQCAVDDSTARGGDPLAVALLATTTPAEVDAVMAKVAARSAAGPAARPADAEPDRRDATLALGDIPREGDTAIAFRLGGDNDDTGGGGPGFDFDAAAAKRKAWMVKRDAAIAAGAVPPRDPSRPRINLGTTAWDPGANPVAFEWAPAWVNSTLNARLARMQGLLDRAFADPGAIVRAILSKLPLTMLVAMPFFALLLKLIYLDRRRLYTEHLVVALHSHAFIFLAMIATTLLDHVSGWSEAAPLLQSGFQRLDQLLWLWIGVYLFLMQKRVYREGWRMTTLRFTITGLLYTVLMGVMIALGAIVGMATT